MNDTQQKEAARQFAAYWKNKGYEKGESQPFWLSLLRDVYGVEHPEQFITFEEQVHLDHTSFIDGTISSTKVLIEQKGLGKDLKKPIKQSDGTLLTPFQQAKRYITELPLSQHPRWVVTCNFEKFFVYDMERPSGEPEEMISVLSAVAEIERENIRVQTMEGRIQKAREGKWNGGFAPYGYKLVDGKLEINEEEAPAIRTIYEQYVTTDSGANGIAKYLENHGISKVQRQNGKNPLFDARLIRMILKNPVYCGKIAYGRRKTEKVNGTRNEYRLVEQENFLLVNGLHEAIIPEDVWQAAQVKLAAQAKRYEHVNKGKNECTHLLSGIVKCPVCGAGMYGNKCVKRKADGSKYKDFYYYGCKHRSMTRGHKCDYKKQIRKELLDDAVAEVICKLVSNPKFAAMMQEKINMKIDTTAIEQEISNYEKQLRQAYSTKSKLIEEIDSLDPDDRHYGRRKSDLDDRLYGMYDKIEELESLLIAARAKKQAIEAEKLTGDNIYKVLIYFDQLYGKMNDREKRQLIEELISEIQIYPERQPNGQWLKSIKFRLPIIEEDMNISLDNEQQVETIVLLQRETL